MLNLTTINFIKKIQISKKEDMFWRLFQKLYIYTFLKFKMLNYFVKMHLNLVILYISTTMMFWNFFLPYIPTLPN
jgi:hypothetical protein